MKEVEIASSGREKKEEIRERTHDRNAGGEGE